MWYNFWMKRPYSTDFRFQALACVKQGKSLEEVCEFFSINRRTLERWIRLEKQTGSVAALPRSPRTPIKVDKDKLLEAIEKSPDSTLEELAALFGCCFQTIDKWCKKLNVTRKKNHAIRGAKRRKKTGI